MYRTICLNVLFGHNEMLYYVRAMPWYIHMSRIINSLSCKSTLDHTQLVVKMSGVTKLSGIDIFIISFAHVRVVLGAHCLKLSQI